MSERVLPNTSCHCIHQFGGHLKNMASISKVIRLSQKLRGVEPSISTLCLGFLGHTLAEKSLVSYVSVIGINHFDVYGGHLTKWRPLQRTIYCDSHKVGVHIMLGVFVLKRKTFP